MSATVSENKKRKTNHENQNDYGRNDLLHWGTRIWAVSTNERPFPLTPALSDGERENRLPQLGPVRAFRFVHRRATRPPLPKGEGWGEGERGVSNAGPSGSSGFEKFGRDRWGRWPSWLRFDAT